MSYRTLNLNEAAAYLHITTAQLEELVRKRKIPFERAGDRIIFRKGELEQWANLNLVAQGNADGQLRDAINRRAHETHADSDSNPALIPLLLTPMRINVELGARTKSSVISEMTMLADETGLVNNPVDLLEALRAREELCSTAVAEGLALLHPRQHDEFMFEESFIALGRAVQPVPFGAPDGRLTDLFFLICCTDDRLHLQTLARLASMCMKTSLIADLRLAENADQMYGLIAAAEIEVLAGTRHG